MSWNREEIELESRKQMWRETLLEFEEHFFPIFSAYGYSKGMALQAYLLDQLETAILIRGDDEHL